MSSEIPPLTAPITIDEFSKVDVRVGRVLDVQDFPEGRSSTHILQIDLGPGIGTRQSLARLSPNYDDGGLSGRQVLCVVNLPVRKIGRHRSEVLTLGLPDAKGDVVLIGPDCDVPEGGRMY